MGHRLACSVLIDVGLLDQPPKNIHSPQLQRQMSPWGSVSEHLYVCQLRHHPLTKQGQSTVLSCQWQVVRSKAFIRRILRRLVVHLTYLHLSSVIPPHFCCNPYLITNHRLQRTCCAVIPPFTLKICPHFLALLRNCPGVAWRRQLDSRSLCWQVKEDLELCDMVDSSCKKTWKDLGKSRV